MQGTHLAFEFHLSFQKLWKFQLIKFLSPIGWFLSRIFVLLFLLVDEYTWILSQFLKKGVGTLISFEKVGELSIVAIE